MGTLDTTYRSTERVIAQEQLVEGRERAEEARNRRRQRVGSHIASWRAGSW